MQIFIYISKVLRTSWNHKAVENSSAVKISKRNLVSTNFQTQRCVIVGSRIQEKRPFGVKLDKVMGSHLWLNYLWFVVYLWLNPTHHDYPAFFFFAFCGCIFSFLSMKSNTRVKGETAKCSYRFSDNNRHHRFFFFIYWQHSINIATYDINNTN